MNSPATAFEHILAILDRLEIAYFVGGSVASSLYGVPRTTMDLDLIADIRLDQIDSFEPNCCLIFMPISK